VDATGTPDCGTATWANNCRKITVFNAINFGTLASGDESFCAGSNDPSNITFSTSPSGGAGTFNYQWYYQDGLAACPSGTSTAGWTLIIGATSNSYDPPSGLLSSRTYAVQVDPTGSPDCGVATWATNCRKVTVFNAVNFGTVTNADESFCSGSNNPSNITLSTAPSGGAGTFTYQWYYQDGIANCPSGTSTVGWTLIGGATANSYDPPTGLTASRTYAVQVDPTGTPDCGVATWATNCRKVTVFNAVDLGTIASGDETFCSTGGDPANIVFSIAPSGGAGTFTYQWCSQNGNIACPTGTNVTGWTPIAGATAANYDPPAGLTQTRTFAVQVNPSGTPDCGVATWANSCRLVTVLSAVNFGTLTSGDQTFCSGSNDPGNITFSTNPSGGSGTFSYQWYYQDGLPACPSGTSTTGWTLIASATGNSYDPPAGLTLSRTYAVMVDPTGTPDCGVSTWATNCIKITVLNAVDYGTVASGDQTFCAGTNDPANITLSSAPSGGAGSFSYQWYYQDGLVTCPTGNSTVGWTLIVGATTNSYNPPLGVTASRTYAVQVDATGVPDCGPATWANGCRKVTVLNAINSGTLTSGDESFCAGSNDPSNITFSTLPTGGSGTYTYQWYYQDGLPTCPSGTSTAGWTLIASATNSSYDPPAGLTISRTYAVQVDPMGSPDCGVATWASGCRKVTIFSAINFGTVASADETICNGGDPSNIVFSAAPSGGAGTFMYQWYYQDGLVTCPSGTSTAGWTLIVGATSNTYDPPTGLTTTRTYSVRVDPTGSPDCGVATWANSCRKVTVLSVLNLGTLTSGDETFCSTGGNPAIITFSTPPSGGTGTYTYQWYFQNGNVACPTGTSTTGWTLITGATANSYDPPAGLTQTRTYAVQVNPTGTPDCGGGMWSNGCRKVTLLPVVNSGTLTSADETFCTTANDPANITFSTSPSGGTGTFTYQWYYQDGLVTCPSGTSLAGWTLIGGATGSSYDPPAGLTVSRTYAVQVNASGSPDCGVATWANNCRKVAVLSGSNNSVRASGVFTYCNSFDNGNWVDGYFVGFRVASTTAVTLNVVDLDGNNVTNRGKRVDNFGDDEPANVTIAPLQIGGGADSLEFWYFGPYANGSTFNIVLVDPVNSCDTIFVASGTYDCADNQGNSDPGACPPNGTADIPLYFLDFTYTAFNLGYVPVGAVVDDDYFIMRRSRVETCCDVPNPYRCMEMIVHLDENDLGLAVDDEGSGNTAGQLFADSLNGFTCTGITDETYPFQQEGGNSNDAPLCFIGIEAREFIVLSCKAGGNDTYLQVGTIKNIYVPPLVTQENCDIELVVFNVDTAFWSSPDDPNLDNLVSCNNDSLVCQFSYNMAEFGPITNCSDTFTYIVGGHPSNTSCLPADTILYDTTYVVVFPTFSISIEQFCDDDLDSVVLVAHFSVNGSGCEYSMVWSTDDTADTIKVPLSNTEYFISVTRVGISEGALACAEAVDSVTALGAVTLDCSLITNSLSSCFSPLPPIDLDLLQVSGCNSSYEKLAHTISNGGLGCMGDTLIYTRYYIVDLDGDTINTLDDRDTCIQLFKFIDSTPPVISCPANVTISCSAVTLPGSTGLATATDNCTMAAITYTDVISGNTCPQTYTITRRWQASDDCGNTTTCNQIISVQDIIGPVINCPANITIQCSQNTLPAVTGTATSNDNCDTTPAITYSDITSAGSCPQSYSISRTWTSTDDCGNSTSCAQLITVIDNIAPAITCPLNVTIQCTVNTLPVSTGSASATDNCDNTPAITYTDVISAGSCPQAYQVIRTWKATDDCGNMNTCNQTITVIDNITPVINCPSNITILCTANTLPPNTGTATSNDNCDNTPLITSTDVITPGACPQAYTIVRTWKSTDACGNMNTCNQVITVIDNLAPAITCPANVTIQCTSNTTPAGTGTATSTDNCDSSPIISSTDVIVPGACPQAYVINRTWTSMDACGNVNSCLQLITVIDNVIPVISCPPNITITCSASTLTLNTGMAVSNDNCDASPVVSSSDVITPGPCPQTYLITRTWISTDDCGNSNSCVQLINVQDTVRPVITCPVDITIDCTVNTNPAVTGSASAVDNCDPAPIVASSDVVVSGICPQSYVITRRWIATDACLNRDTCFQVITVQDTIRPVLSCPANVTIDCTASTNPVNTGSANATDSCDPAPSVSSSDIITGGPCPQSYIITRRWIAVDACMNHDTCFQTIFVQDTMRPVISCPANVTIDCTADSSPTGTGLASAIDSCDPGPSINFDDITTAGDCPQEYIITRRWIASDACQNKDTCFQFITVQDTMRPVLSCPP
jgi:hypothetical protein